MNDLRQLRGLIFDLDGVIRRGDRLLPGAVEMVEFLHRRGLPFLVATNNATASAAQLARKLGELGFALPAENILTSAQATASLMKTRIRSGAPVMMIGEEGLREALIGAGFAIQDRADQVLAVVVGMDRKLDWARMAEAAYAIRAGADFVATNGDVSFPTERGLAPGNGSIVVALELTTGRKALVVGKPEPHLFLEARSFLDRNAEQVLVVGDRLETDVLGAQRAGMASALLLTGVTDRTQLAGSAIRPDWVFNDLFEMRQAIDRQDRNP